MRALVLMCVLAIGNGCVENDQTLTINQFAFIDPTAMCEVMASSTVSVSSGTLDVATVLGGANQMGYRVAPVIENNSLERATATAIETDGIQLTGVNVELTPSPDLANALPVAMRKFFVPAAGGLVKPAGSNPLFVSIIPAQIAVEVAPAIPVFSGASSASQPYIIAQVRPVGTSAGETVIGGPVDFPVTLCNGCLIGPTSPPEACPLNKNTTLEPGGCVIGNDTPITCCAASRQLICGQNAIAPMM